ncbi:ABC transporter substrate-binding protein [Arthrobacter sp. AFG7.2]|uniref:ABC transporter substrate-binding protein n=1 Tax=Arthrobacter sp. AFG7.2 TaxID=1688693 RepID=UPI0016705CD8|nr:sugar ABC transporter substrate-binding protein [Arthrobacter sp. AFG7.2]
MVFKPSPPRKVRTIAAVLAAVVSLGVAGCGSPAADDSVTLRFNWWGSDARHAQTQQVIERFEEAHPNIKVQPEFSNFSDYFNKLSTSAASRDLPDVMQMTDPHLYTYIDNGQLVDLGKHSDVLPTGDFSEASLAGTQIDGGLYGIPTGDSGFGMAVNPALFEKAGVPLPDDNTWTWDEFKDTAAAISKALPDVAGTSITMDEQTMNLWIRQHGEDYWKNGGSEIGFTAETAASWWEFVRSLRDSGGTQPVEAELESASLALEQSPLALGKKAMTLISVNQLGNLEKAAGQEFKLFRLPGEQQFKAEGGWTKPGIYYSVAANSEHPKEAAMLIDFLTHAPEAGEIVKFDRGVPSSSKMLEAITPSLTPVEGRVAEYVTRINELGTPAYAIPHPKAGGVLIDTVKRLSQEVVFDRMTPRQAADQLLADVKAAM